MKENYFGKTIPNRIKGDCMSLEGPVIFWVSRVAGSDLAGETAAALAAVALVFRDVNPGYSSKCLEHAKQLYRFASQYRGLYHEAIKGAAQYYE
jgi:hypothetical protein